ASISPCQVGSFSATTLFAPSPMIRPSCTITAPNTPPALSIKPVFSESSIARAMNFLSSSVIKCLQKMLTGLPPAAPNQREEYLQRRYMAIAFYVHERRAPDRYADGTAAQKKALRCRETEGPSRAAVPQRQSASLI